MLRIGIVGTGLIAWAHGLGLQAMIDSGVIDASIAVVHDRRHTRAERFAATNGAVVAESTEAVVERCDAVWVCTPTSAHRAVVEAAVAAGRAVFCEKPLATDLAGAQALTEAVATAGVPAQSGLVLRSAPVFRALRELIDSGGLGRPMAAVFRDDQYFPIQGTYGAGTKWRADVEQAGGGCLIEHSIHDLDILRFCFGEVAQVAGRTSNFSGHPGIEDVAAVSMQFDSGLTAHLSSVWHNILSRGSTRRIEVFCQDGMVWLDNEFRGPLHVQTSETTEARPCPSPPWVDALPFGNDQIGLGVSPYVEADRAFVDAVVAGRTPEPDLHEALVAHRLVDAAYRSAGQGGVPVALG
jgi:predicted dehydrogenase